MCFRRELGLIQLSVQAIPLQELCVAAQLNQVTVIQHYDHVTISDCRQAVRNDDGGALPGYISD